jgi:hypothetical protein
MKTVFNAANSFDAYLVLDLLNQVGITGRVEGEFLTGAMGELPAFDLVRVVVNESDYSLARQIILEWEGGIEA